MTRIACVDPQALSIKGMGKCLGVSSWAEPERVEYYNQVRPYAMQVEVTLRCAGSCAYCYAASTPETETTIPTEKIKELMDEAVEIGIKSFDWLGGDPILHPDWYELACYAQDKGLSGFMCTSSMISKKVAKQLYQLRKGFPAVLVDISTINPRAYAQLHTDPKTLEVKIQGYQNLLEAGFPPEEVLPIMAISKPAVETFEETVDWFIDEMGASTICLVQFKPDEFGTKYLHLEPSLEEVKKVLEYRAKRLGEHWLRIGSMDTSIYMCATLVAIKGDGRVTPCANIPVAFGNIYQESLKEILKRHADDLLYNRPIEGFCGNGQCPNKDVCFGCRANAYFTSGGNFFSSDGKCFLNPEAKEYCFH